MILHNNCLSRQCDANSNNLFIIYVNLRQKQVLHLDRFPMQENQQNLTEKREQNKNKTSTISNKAETKQTIHC